MRLYEILQGTETKNPPELSTLELISFSISSSSIFDFS